MLNTPKTGFKGLTQNWQSDLTAAFSVSLVALPLALGIAYASNVPPMAGIVSAIIGGVVTTFFRGSHVAINGPAAGLIAVILSSLLIWEGDPLALNYVLAAIVVSGAIQILLGVLKLGKYAELLHSTVIHGVMAAIGVIIFAKQIHVAMGTTTTATAAVDTLIDAVKQIPNINPFVATISLAGLLLLIFQSKISFKLFHIIPAPVWVLALSIPFVYIFNFFDQQTINFLGKGYEVGPKLLINIPSNILDAITHPNFSKIGTWKFWSSVISITMIASIQSMAMGKAVDKLDPYKRKTDFNKDLIGVGLATMVAGALGGLPIINVIVRSTVNVHNHAKTKWSNLYHGIFLLIFIFLLAPAINKVPLAALAILLVYTGYKLASPKVFRHVMDQGIEQTVFFIGTLMITLYSNLLMGIFGGMLLVTLTHILLTRLTTRSFFHDVFNSGSNLFVTEDGSYELKIKGVANFLGSIKMDKLLNQLPEKSSVSIDLREARLVDFSVMEKLYEFQRTHGLYGGQVEIEGLDEHISSTNHKMGLKLITTSKRKMTSRSLGIKQVAEQYGWKYDVGPIHKVDNYQQFYFFQSRPIEFKTNCLWSKGDSLKWEITDVTFEEGAFMAYAEFRTSVGLIELPYSIPKFTIERKEMLDKFIDLSLRKDIDYQTHESFSENFTVKVESEQEIDDLLINEIIAFMESNNIPHLESSGKALMIFPCHFKLAHLHEYSKIISMIRELKQLLVKSQISSAETINI